MLHSSERFPFHNTVVPPPFNILTMTVHHFYVINHHDDCATTSSPSCNHTLYVSTYSRQHPTPNSTCVNFVPVCHKDLSSIFPPRPLFSPDKQKTCHLPELSHDFPLFPVHLNDLSSVFQSRPRSYQYKIHAFFRGLVICQPTAWSFSICVNFTPVCHQDLSSICQSCPLFSLTSIEKVIYLNYHIIVLYFLFTTTTWHLFANHAHVLITTRYIPPSENLSSTSLLHDCFLSISRHLVLYLRHPNPNLSILYLRQLSQLYHHLS